jgi:hypothetical protein
MACATYSAVLVMVPTRILSLLIEEIFRAK